MKKLVSFFPYYFNRPYQRQQKFLWLFLLLASGGLILLTVIAYRNDRTFKSTSYWIRHTQRMLETSTQLTLLAKDLQMNSGAYLLKRDSSYIITYKKLRAEIPEKTSLLKQLSSKSSIQKVKADAIDRQLAILIKFCDQTFHLNHQTPAVRSEFFVKRRLARERLDKLVIDFEKVVSHDLKIKEKSNSEAFASSNRMSKLIISSIFISLITVGYSFNKRKVVEEYLYQSKEQYEVLLNNIQDYGIFLLDTDGSILNCNCAASRINGLGIDEMLGKSISIFYTQEDLLKGKPEKHLLRAMLEGKFEGEGWRIRKNGSTFWAHTSITPLRDREGQIRGFTMVTRDDTLRKSAETEILKALEKEKELNEMKSNFLTMTSHEFKTPLGVIVTSALVIGKLKGAAEQDERIRNINRIILSAKNLNTIVSEFLSVQQLEDGKTEKSFKSFNLKHFTAQLCKQLNQLSKRGQSIIYIHQGDEEILSDEFILRQIFTNLITNGFKYSPENSQIKITTTVSDKIIVQIKDSGIGIPEKDRSYLFQRFYRASNALHLSGTGLGLYIVKKLVSELNGTIELDSSDSKGTIFKITFEKNILPMKQVEGSTEAIS